MSDETISVEDFRQKVRAWLPDNLERRPPGRQLMTRGLGHKTVEGIAAERQIQRRIHDAGFAALTWPREYGGQGLTPAHQKVWNAETRDYRRPDFGIVGGTTMVVCANTILRHAPEDFRLRHLPAIFRGDELWVQFFSEPGAGSDLAGVTTRATRDGDHWVLSGQKVWTSGAYYADWGMCLARTDWDAPKHRGLTWFAVPTDAPGVTVRPIREINGDIEFCEEFLDDVVVPDTERISEVNEGWSVTQTVLAFERGGGGTTEAGALLPPRDTRRHLPSDLVGLARRVGREKDPHTRQLIARAYVNDFAVDQLTARVSGLMRQRGGLDAGVAAYGKLAQGTYGPIRGRLAMEIGGGGAVAWPEDDIEGLTNALNYLNSRVMSIAGGTNEMQRNGVGERVLGLPREPSFDSTKPFSDVLRNAGNWSGKV